MKIYKLATLGVAFILTIGLFGCEKDLNNQNSIQPSPPIDNTELKTSPIIIETPVSEEPLSKTMLSVDETLISAVINELCATPRKWGTDGETRAGAYIEQQMKSYGYEPEEQIFPVYKTGLHSFYSDFFNMNPEQSEVLGYGRNIIFTKPSSAKTDETFIISAHYDSISDCVSAIDNASGVAVIMEAARILKSYELPFKLKFVFFSAEEYYITGSRNYVFHLSENERNAILGCINVDMVGESGGGDLEFRTAEGHSVLTLLYKNLFPDETLKSGSGGTSDDASFTKAYIPALTIAQGNPNYELQKLESDLEFLETDGCMRAAQLIIDFMVSYDISAHEQLLNDMPSQDLDISLPYFSDPAFIFKFSKGSLPGYTIVNAHQSLLANGVASEYVCEYENNHGMSYSISQTLYAAPHIDISEYKKVVVNEWSFGTYYIYSDEVRTTLVCLDGSFLLKIDGQISENDAIAIFQNMKSE